MGPPEVRAALLLRRTSVLALALACGCDQPTLRARDIPDASPPCCALPAAPTDELDLLFVIDDTAGMAHKQALLADAVPYLIARLTAGEPAMSGLRDVHVGVISSSLGARGGDVCSNSPTEDRKGRLLGGTPGAPFLNWNSDASVEPGDASADTSALDPASLAGALAGRMRVGTFGCEYPAPLEAWYRFLVDPQPPDTVTLDDGGFTQVLRCEGEGTACGDTGRCVAGFCADNVVLTQRAQFLRGNSVVAIVILSDENDCSIRDDGQGGLVTSLPEGQMPKAAAVCQLDPDDPGCTFTAETLPASQDRKALRCWDQKRRFGVDFLFPTSRYVAALTELNVPDRSGNPTPNPLFSSGGAVPRGPGRIILTGILGVPWQRVSTEDSQNEGATLEYLPAHQIDWPQITKSGNLPPGDVRMVESDVPRPSLPSFDDNPNSDPIIGHDWNTSATGELQSACIFPLAEPRDCSAGAWGCACNSTGPRAGVPTQNPLCWDGSQYGTTQTHARATPALRQLAVLRDFGNDAIAASICPKEVHGDPLADGYGFNPAMRALAERIKAKLERSR